MYRIFLFVFNEEATWIWRRGILVAKTTIDNFVKLLENWFDDIIYRRNFLATYQWYT